MEIKFMQRALELVQQAAAEDEVPIGAVIVNPENGEIIAEAYNQSEHVLDSTAHAEISAIQKACQALGQNRLRGLDLYVTLEPCTMCAAAISFARIANVYFGAYDEKRRCNRQRRQILPSADLSPPAQCARRYFGRRKRKIIERFLQKQEAEELRRETVRGLEETKKN